MLSFEQCFILFSSFPLLFAFVVGGLGFEFCVFVAGWRHALRSEWPSIIIIIILVTSSYCFLADYYCFCCTDNLTSDLFLWRFYSSNSKLIGIKYIITTLPYAKKWNRIDLFSLGPLGFIFMKLPTHGCFCACVCSRSGTATSGLQTSCCVQLTPRCSPFRWRVPVCLR